MKRFLIGAIGLALCACAPLITAATSGLPTPAAISGLTTADEKAAVTAELGYKAWRTAITLGVQTHVIKGTLAGQVAALDTRLYTALIAVEHAKAAADATSLSIALDQFNAALADGNAAIGAK